MEKNFFRDFVDLIKKENWHEFSSTAKYREMLNRRIKADSELMQHLGDEALLDNYFAEVVEMQTEYEYFLCEKVVRTFVELIKNAGLI